MRELEADSTTKVASVCGLWFAGVAAYLRIRLSSVAFNSFSSPVLRCWFKVFLHLVRSATIPSQDAAVMSFAIAETSVVIVRVINITLVYGYNSVLWFSASAAALR